MPHGGRAQWPPLKQYEKRYVAASTNDFRALEDWQSAKEVSANAQALTGRSIARVRKIGFWSTVSPTGAELARLGQCASRVARSRDRNWSPYRPLKQPPEHPSTRARTLMPELT